jgi:hypothetical protein
MWIDRFTEISVCRMHSTHDCMQDLREAFASFLPLSLAWTEDKLVSFFKTNLYLDKTWSDSMTRVTSAEVNCALSRPVDREDWNKAVSRQQAILRALLNVPASEPLPVHDFGAPTFGVTDEAEDSDTALEVAKEAASVTTSAVGAIPGREEEQKELILF